MPNDHPLSTTHPTTHHPTPNHPTPNHPLQTTIPADLIPRLGELSAQAQTLLINRFATGPADHAAIDRHCATLRVELAGPNPTSLERLLVDRIVACWLQLQHADLAAIVSLDRPNLALREYTERRQNRAQARYLAAIRSLAQVRRLLQPAIQLNIADQQINIVKE